MRYARFKQPQRFIDAALAGGAVEEERRLQASDLPFEFMLNALRLIDGVPATMFEERTGLAVTAIAAAMNHAADQGLVDADPARIQATPRGLQFLNDLQARFLDDPAAPA